MEIRSGVFGDYDGNERRHRFSDLTMEILNEVSDTKDYEYSKLEIVEEKSFSGDLDYSVIDMNSLKKVASFRVDEERKEGQLRDNNQEYGHLDIELVATIDIKEENILTEDIVELLDNEIYDEDLKPLYLEYDRNLREFISSNYEASKLSEVTIESLSENLDSYEYKVKGVNY